MSGQEVEQGVAGRGQGVVVPVGGATKRTGLADERPGDDSPDIHRRHEIEGDLAHPIEILHRDDVFVRRNLKDAVGRRVDDGPAGPDVLRAKAIDDLGA